MQLNSGPRASIRNMLVWSLYAFVASFVGSAVVIFAVASAAVILTAIQFLNAIAG